MRNKKYRWEIVECFKNQYPKRWERYKIFVEEHLCLPSQKSIQRAIVFINSPLLYCDLVEDMGMIVKIIIELEGLNTQVKSA